MAYDAEWRQWGNASLSILETIDGRGSFGTSGGPGSRLFRTGLIQRFVDPKASQTVRGLWVGNGGQSKDIVEFRQL